MTLTKRDIAKAIHEAQPEISITEGVSLVDTIFEVIVSRLEREEKVMITNFGTFRLLQRASRHGMNPATGARMIIPTHRAIAFRPAPGLEKAVNG